MEKSLLKVETTNNSESSILIRLRDLEKQSQQRNLHIESNFLDEEELAQAYKEFPASNYIRYDGGYENARKKKVIFRVDMEDDFSDIVCIKADIDTRFRKITHRDILGALMGLQIARNTFGDFWIEEDSIYLYTSSSMAKFLIENFIKIANLSVTFYQIEEKPEQPFHTKKIQVVVSQPRLDAIVAALAHTSRNQAKEMIQAGKVQLNHVVLVSPDELCNNNVTISIRGVGRFEYLGIVSKTRKNRLVIEVNQYI